jgi:hypothetical protein
MQSIQPIPVLLCSRQDDPMAFASCYATVASVIDRPEPVTRVRASLRMPYRTT